MRILKLELNNEFMSSNCYLLIKNDDVIIIDPSFEDNKLYSYLEEQKLNVNKIILTHSHYDHWTGLEKLRKLYPKALLYGSLKDSYWYLNNPFTQYKPKVDVDLNLLEHIDFFDLKAQVIKTPGHSICSVSFYFDNKLISGDVLFYEGIGRSDLYGGNFIELEKSILELYKLPDNTTVYPGHGRPTTIGHEKLNNPFVKYKKTSFR